MHIVFVKDMRVKKKKRDPLVAMGVVPDAKGP